MAEKGNRKKQSGIRFRENQGKNRECASYIKVIKDIKCISGAGGLNGIKVVATAL
ncbi:hypothetical protein FACS1894120_0720 [Clostridia bacterium]|nr:hypothetical protein FACS1894120_0720 [Clostridia bacterium]